jgi:HK97 family phage prohead protease
MKKQFNSYEIKNIPLEVKDMDSVGRRVKVMLAHFNNIDSDRDVIRKGAFAKSIQERGANTTTNRKIAFLRYHDWEHPIGKFISLEETDEGLLAVGELGRSSKANDAFLDYQDGIIREHSIGFNYIQDKMQLVGEGEQAYFEIKEVILWEGSAVTFGANSLTPVLDVSKAEAKQDYLKELNEQMGGYLKALRNGQGTDERLFQIEMGLKVCQQKYNSLIENVPSVAHTVINKSDKVESEEQQKQFFINLTNN